jgi:hypothetical protein
MNEQEYSNIRVEVTNSSGKVLAFEGKGIVSLESELEVESFSIYVGEPIPNLSYYNHRMVIEWKKDQNSISYYAANSYTRKEPDIDGAWDEIDEAALRQDYEVK